MTNMQLAEIVISQSLRQGVRTFCVCPGGRNAPILEILGRSPSIECLTFFDERSASFFALGRARRDRRPVAVVTTSGTAVTEMISAAVEAYYTRAPVLFITADRPKRYRGTGAPQSIEQVGTFSHYVEVAEDWDSSSKIVSDWAQNFGAQWNICFEEPVIDAPIGSIESLDFAADPKVPSKDSARSSFDGLGRIHRPLVIVGGLEAFQQGVCLDFLKKFHCPIYLEGPSGLREEPNLQELATLHSRRLQYDLAQGAFDGVLRIGDVPTTRVWRDLENLDLPIFSINSKPFSGGVKVQHITAPCEAWGEAIGPPLSWDCQGVLKTHGFIEKRFRNLLLEFPKSELGWFQKISGMIDSRSSLYVGNSLPIRNWDLAAQRDNPQWVRASRGANGIDGQLATAMGLSDPTQTNWIVLGDLTALYDMSSLLIAGQMDPETLRLHLVVINNRGGKIFSNMFQSPLFLNSQNVDFQKLAESMGWSYTDGDSFGCSSSPGCRFVEVVPDLAETKKMSQHYGEICKL